MNYCIVESCSNAIPAFDVFCKVCWDRLPPHYKAAISGAPKGTDGWRAAVVRARDYLQGHQP